MSEASNDSANPSVGGYSGGSGEAGSTTESDPRNSASGSVGNNPSPRRGDEASHEGVKKVMTIVRVLVMPLRSPLKG